MRIEIFNSLPIEAKKIREAVFTDEQGFTNEFDEIDRIAVHFVLYDKSGNAIATCRLFRGDPNGVFIVGRIAVMKGFRGQGLGTLIVGHAADHAKDAGAAELWLHAQCRAEGFYRGLGFISFGDTDEEDGCPHVWMRRVL